MKNRLHKRFLGRAPEPDRVSLLCLATHLDGLALENHIFEAKADQLTDAEAGVGEGRFSGWSACLALLRRLASTVGLVSMLLSGHPEADAPFDSQEARPWEQRWTWQKSCGGEK